MYADIVHCSHISCHIGRVKDKDVENKDPLNRLTKQWRGGGTGECE